jgi:hypothetical protein
VFRRNCSVLAQRGRVAGSGGDGSRDAMWGFVEISLGRMQRLHTEGGGMPGMAQGRRCQGWPREGAAPTRVRASRYCMFARETIPAEDIRRGGAR